MVSRLPLTPGDEKATNPPRVVSLGWHNAQYTEKQILTHESDRLCLKKGKKLVLQVAGLCNTGNFLKVYDVSRRRCSVLCLSFSFDILLPHNHYKNSYKVRFEWPAKDIHYGSPGLYVMALQSYTLVKEWNFSDMLCMDNWGTCLVHNSDQVE